MVYDPLEGYASVAEYMKAEGEAAAKALGYSSAEEYYRVLNAVGTPNEVAGAPVWRMNSRGEMISSVDYNPGTSGYGQDYSDNRGAVSKYLYFVTQAKNDGVTTSPDSTFENMQKTFENMQKTFENLQKTVSDPFAGIRGFFSGINWKGMILPVGLVAVGGLFLWKSIGVRR